jgi:hypothetical protein
MSIFKRAVRKVLNESSAYDYRVDGEADDFVISEGNVCVGVCHYKCPDAIPFIICNGKIYEGKPGFGHRSCNAPKNAEEYDDFVAGRLWIEVPSQSRFQFPYSVLSFWNDENEHIIDCEIIDKLLDDYGIDSSDVLVASFNDNDYGSMYSYDEWSFEVEEANERQKEARAIHLMNAEDKHDATSGFRTNRDRLIGKKLTDKNGVEMPLAKYHSMIRSENKNSKNAKQIT